MGGCLSCGGTVPEEGGPVAVEEEIAASLLAEAVHAELFQVASLAICLVEEDLFQARRAESEEELW